MNNEFPIPATGVMTVRTKNSLYLYDVDAGTVQGGDHLPTPVQGRFIGVAYREGFVEGKVIVGSQLKIMVNHRNDLLTTSQVTEVPSLRRDYVTQWDAPQADYDERVDDREAKQLEPSFDPKTQFMFRKGNKLYVVGGC